MTSFTPVYAMPYPDALDEPCDFAEDWCAFTAAADAVLDRFELGAQRVLPAVPVAVVAVTEQSTVLDGIGVSFDTVFSDTAGWTNFDANTQTITVSRAGRYTVNGAVTVGSTFVVNSTISLLIRAPGVIAQMTALDRVFGNIGINTGREVVTLDAGTPVSMIVQWSTSTPTATLPLFSAALSVIWHADEERP